jgi:hypothetical protein
VGNSIKFLIETIVEFKKNTKLKYPNMEIVTKAFLQSATPGGIIKYDEESSIVNSGEVVFKVNKTTKFQATSPFTGAVSNIMMQKGEFQKFQSGTKLYFMQDSSVTFKVVDKIIIKHPDSIKSEVQEYAASSLVSFNRGTVFVSEKILAVKWMVEGERRVTLPNTDVALVVIDGEERVLGEEGEEGDIEIAAGERVYPPGTKIVFLSALTMNTMAPVKFRTFQPTLFKDTKYLKARETVTYDRSIKIRVNSNGKVRFLQETMATIHWPYRSSAEQKTFMANDEVYLILKTKMTLNDPAKISISVIDDISWDTIARSTFIVTQKSDESAGSFIIPCNPLCKDCFGATKFHCNKCWNNFYIENNTCLCPLLGFTLSSIYIFDAAETSGFRNEITCKKCDISCHRCDGPGPANC